MKYIKRFFIILLSVIFLFIIGVTTYIHFEKENKEEYLISILEEKTNTKKDSYKISSSSYTYMGYYYAVKFNDEPNVQYEFFVKTTPDDEYDVVYYTYDLKEEAPGPKRDSLFTEKINEF